MAAGSSPPYAVWNENDHSGPILIVTTLCALYWLVAGIGQQVLSVSSSLKYSWGDILFTSSMVTGLIQTVLVLAACSIGLGKSSTFLKHGDLVTAEKLYYVSNIFYVLALGFIKCSAACFIANLTVKNMGSLRQVPREQMLWMVGVVTLSVLWTIGAAIALGLPCSTGVGDVCMGTVNRWVGVFVGDAVSDISIVAFAASVVWRTNASVSKRIVWYIPFALRALVPLWAGLRLFSISTPKLNHDPTLSLWLFITLTQVQIFLSLIGAAAPALKKTMLDLQTHFGATTESQTNSKGGTNTFPLKYLSASRRNASQQPSSHTDSKTGRMPFQGPGRGGSVIVGKSRHHDDRIRTGSDGDSQKGIIREDEYEVSYDHAGSSSDREPGVESSYARSR